MLDGKDLMNSSRQTISRPLAQVNAVRARRFLLELANLLGDAEAVARFERKFGKFLPWAEEQTVVIEGIDSGEHVDSSNLFTIDLSNVRLFSLRDTLRSIWTTSDLKAKEWRIFLFRADTTTDVSLLSAAGPPPPNPFQQSVLYLLRWAAKTRCCHNRGCTSPYFLASRSSQKYCSEDCAIPAQRAYKLDWWRENGRNWRKRQARRPKRKKRN